MKPVPARLRTLTVAVATTALAAAACAGDEDAPNVDDLGVVDVQELDLPFSDAFLSPDGERIATYEKPELCIFSASGEEERCVDEELLLDPNSIRWNPDGTRLVFTEDFFRSYNEPDIWLLDAESGELTDLTDDGIEESGFDVLSDPDDSEDTPDIDTVPAWVDDGSTVRFLRWHHADEDNRSVEVMEVPADGGDPESVGSLATEVVPTDIAYTTDERAAYPRQDHEDFVLSDLSGENAEPIADDMDTLAWASDSGEDLLLVPNVAGDYLAEWPTAEVLPADGGEPTEVADSVRWATWRSGSDGLAYASVEGDDPRETTLYLKAGAENDSREITSGTYVPPFRQALMRSPVWSEQDTILLMEYNESEGDESESTDGELGEEFSYVLLHLGTG